MIGPQGGLTKTNYQTQVYRILEDMIIHGKLKSGERLIESEIAASMGVSRSPVREAIVALCQEGLVINGKRGGWVVSEVSLDDILEFFEVRKFVESTAAMQGCLYRSEEIMHEMERLVQELDKAEDLEAFRENDISLHELIVLSGGNKKFRDVYVWARRNIRWCGYLNWEVPGRRERTKKEHEAILDCFTRRDPEAVKKAIEYHIDSIERTVRENCAACGVPLGTQSEQQRAAAVGFDKGIVLSGLTGFGGSR